VANALWGGTGGRKKWWPTFKGPSCRFPGSTMKDSRVGRTEFDPVASHR